MKKIREEKKWKKIKNKFKTNKLLFVYYFKLILFILTHQRKN